MFSATLQFCALAGLEFVLAAAFVYGFARLVGWGLQAHGTSYLVLVAPLCSWSYPGSPTMSAVKHPVLNSDYIKSHWSPVEF